MLELSLIIYAIAVVVVASHVIACWNYKGNFLKKQKKSRSLLFPSLTDVYFKYNKMLFFPPQP